MIPNLYQEEQSDTPPDSISIPRTWFTQSTYFHLPLICQLPFMSTIKQPQFNKSTHHEDKRSGKQTKMHTTMHRTRSQTRNQPLCHAVAHRKHSKHKNEKEPKTHLSAAITSQPCTEHRTQDTNYIYTLHTHFLQKSRQVYSNSRPFSSVPVAAAAAAARLTEGTDCWIRA